MVTKYEVLKHYTADEMVAAFLEARTVFMTNQLGAKTAKAEAVMETLIDAAAWAGCLDEVVQRVNAKQLY